MHVDGELRREGGNNKRREAESCLNDKGYEVGGLIWTEEDKVAADHIM